MSRLNESEQLIARGEWILAEIAGAEKARVEEVGKGTSHKQFGNNFFMLFMFMRLPREELERRDLLSFIQEAESHDESWKRFLQGNDELIGEINDALDGLKPYDLAVGHFTDLLNGGFINDAKAFRNRVDPDLGTEALAIPAWNRLNPLLVYAATAMQDVGINPQDFYG